MNHTTFCNYTKRLGKHCFFSIAGTSIDTLTLWIVSTYILAGSYFTENIVSPFISFQFGNLVNFLIASHYVWGDRMAGKTKKQFWRRYIAFNLSYFTVFFVKMGLLLIIHAIFSWDVVVCNIIAVTFAGFINFIVNDKLIFRDKSGKGSIITQTEFAKALESDPGSGEVHNSEAFADEPPVFIQ